MRSLVTTLYLGVAALCLTQTASAADFDKLIPGNAEDVATFNIKQTIDSPIFKKYGKEQFDQLMKNPGVSDVLKAVNIDPMKDLDSVTVAARFDVMMTKKAV